MLIGEPPPTQGDVHFVLFGIPVRIHPFFWLVGVLLVAGELFQAPDLREALLVFLPWMMALFVAILVHELGHAWAMRAYGFSPSIVLYGLGGLTSYNPGLAYTARGTGTWAQVLISVAGPAAGFLLAALVAGVAKAAGYEVIVVLVARVLPLVVIPQTIGSEAFTLFLNDVLFISTFWGLINLMPVYPLDGGQIARQLLMHINPRDGIRQSLVLSTATGIGLAVFALVALPRPLLPILFFGYLAYMSYVMLQAYSSGGWWR
ncbi:MAG TPA: hypothetical protein EYP56_18700 [Planctomycetaceae bacterium]|nr:hypothetical protein [Planctomycetaceae bacterium]